MGNSPSALIEQINWAFQELRMLASVAEQMVRISRYSSVAVYTVLVYDWLLLLSEEIRLIHKARLTSMKLAYLFCRYYPLLVFPLFLYAWLADHTAAECRPIIHALYAAAAPFQLSAQAVICFRTYAFTGQNRFIGAFLIVACVAIFSAQAWLYGAHFVLVEEVFLLIGNTGCYANDKSAQTGSLFGRRPAPNTGLIALFYFLFDLFCMSLVVVHCARLRSTQGKLGAVFIRQGIVVFVVTSFLNLASASVYLLPTRQYDDIFLPYTLILSEVMVCRLILLLRRYASPTEASEIERTSRVVREAFARLDHEEAGGTSAGGEGVEEGGRAEHPPYHQYRHKKQKWKEREEGEDYSTRTKRYERMLAADQIELGRIEILPEEDGNWTPYERMWRRRSWPDTPVTPDTPDTEHWGPSTSSDHTRDVEVEEEENWPVLRRTSRT